MVSKLNIVSRYAVPYSIDDKAYEVISLRLFLGKNGGRAMTSSPHYPERSIRLSRFFRVMGWAEGFSVAYSWLLFPLLLLSKSIDIVSISLVFAMSGFTSIIPSIVTIVKKIPEESFAHRDLSVVCRFGVALIIPLYIVSTDVWHFAILELVRGTFVGLFDLSFGSVRSSIASAEKIQEKLALLNYVRLVGQILGYFLAGLLALMTTLVYAYVAFFAIDLSLAAVYLSFLPRPESRQAISTPPASFNFDISHNLKVTLAIIFLMNTFLHPFTLFLAIIYGTNLGGTAFLIGIVFAITSIIDVIEVYVCGKISERPNVTTLLRIAMLPSSLLLALISMQTAFPAFAVLLICFWVIGDFEFLTRYNLMASSVRPDSRDFTLYPVVEESAHIVGCLLVLPALAWLTGLRPTTVFWWYGVSMYLLVATVLYGLYRPGLPKTPSIFQFFRVRKKGHQDESTTSAVEQNE